MTQSVRRFLSLTSMVLVAGLIIVASRLDTVARIEVAENQMRSQGLAITELVAEASSHGIQTFNAWEKETNDNLLTSALWVARADSLHGLTNTELERFAQDLGLWGILVFDAAGRLEFSGGPMQREPGAPGNLPAGMLQMLKREPRGVRLLGRDHDPETGQDLLMAGVVRSGGGALLLSLQMGDRALRRREMGPGHLIKVVADIPGIQYVILQDRDVILAASTSSVNVKPSATDPNLQPLFQGAETVDWEHETALGPVLEVARKVGLASGREVILRVGLDAVLLDNLEDDIRRRAIMRMALFLGSMGLILSLFWAWQRQRALDREVQKVTWELRMREEEARRSGRLVAMGHLASGVAHQIRNPLNSIHLIAQVLKRNETLPPDVLEHAGHIRDESGRIESIVQQFLDFAKPRPPVFEEVDLVPLARNAVRVQTIAHAGVDFTVESGRESLPMPLDRQLMVEILENLLRNAAEALQGQGRVVVSIVADRQSVQIVVADNGPGIGPGLREKVFDLYFTTRPQGSGLGLSLVSQMVSVMGGNLSLDDEPGLEERGARFVIRLPRKRRNG